MNGLELKRITDAPHKALGERALALGMPFEDIDGLADGAHEDSMADHCRVGCFHVMGFSDEYCDFASGDLHKVSKKSWPDFRDPVTEAWLHMWGSDEIGGIVYQYVDHGWVYYSGGGPDNWFEVHAKSRAEVWIAAIERLRGKDE